MTGASGVLPAAALLLCLGGCGPDPTRLDVKAQATNDINPSEQSFANPVVVRMYGLANKDTFTSSDFTPLYTADRKTLAADIVSRDEFEVRPGEQHTVEVKDAKGATYVGVLAAFGDIDNSKWRDTAEVKPNTDNTYDVNVRLGSITIQRRRGFWSFLDIF